MIEVQNLSVSFGKRAARVTAVRDISFAIAEGEALGLVGESGCGKSTVLRTLAGLTHADSGRMALDGETLGPIRSKAQRRQLQLMFQDPYGSLHPNQTIETALSEPLAIHRIADRHNRITAALTEVGLPAQHRFRYPHQLSGGQRQRVALARALILEPRVLLLDEPTSALDVSVQAEILNLLVHLRRTRRLTMLMVSHDLAVVAHLCSRIAVMSEGQIVEVTTPDSLADGKVAHPHTRILLESALELS
jgi:peptide/nickel transport system ATP-binding protein